MFYIADLHIHSRFSRATSKQLNLESLYQWAQIKGINVIGTGDFTHPQWFRELSEKLEPDGTGFYRLRNPPEETGLPGVKVKNTEVRFCLSSEISCIYKYGDKVRKNHNLVFAPDLETVARINARLSAIGNLTADGRPILGLPSRDLLEIVTSCSDRAYLIPAHVWTPWFSTLGSKGGYDSVDECFRDLSPLVFALETGLSSDPMMNWRWSALDRFTLISNSDAHSPRKIGREATLFNTGLSYDEMFSAMKSREGFVGTYEFYPQEGKYFLDGHRNCGIIWDPSETRRYNGICPVCGHPITAGVLNRVEALSDRDEAMPPAVKPSYNYIIPLPEVLGEIKGLGPESKAVQAAFVQALSQFGNEFSLLNDVPVEDIKKYDVLLGEAVRRMRCGAINATAGYDGVFGRIKVFEEGEIGKLSGEQYLFDLPLVQVAETAQSYESVKPHAGTATEPSFSTHGLNEQQQAVLDSDAAMLLVKAGPGTGKTRVLTEWLADILQSGQALPCEVMAITFTRKAAGEIKSRLVTAAGPKADEVRIGTFHALAWDMLKAACPNLNTVYDAGSRLSVLRFLNPGLNEATCKKLAGAMADFMETAKASEMVGFDQTVDVYRNYLESCGAVDLSDIIGKLVWVLENKPTYRTVCCDALKVIAIDEFQDINPMQYRLIELLGADKRLLAIGDPDQSIYGFRGSDLRLFFKFETAFKPAVFGLTRNYRSVPGVIKAAARVIGHNALRSHLLLTPQRAGRDKVTLFSAPTPEQEAAFIAAEIEKKVGGTNLLSGGKAFFEGDYGYSDVAVLYRSHLVGRQLLKAFKAVNMPLLLVDGSNILSQAPFDFVAHALQLSHNPQAFIALEGVLSHLSGWNRQSVRDFLTRLRETTESWLTIDVNSGSEKRDAAFIEYRKFYEETAERLKSTGVKGVIAELMNRWLPAIDKNEELAMKRELLLTLAEDAGEDAGLFLQRLQLDHFTNEGVAKVQGVRLLTFHAAKGLEFPVVFIAGAEEGISPSVYNDSDTEEERRLFYVALTRARDELYITNSASRMIYGSEQKQKPSRFINEIGQDLLTKAAKDPAKPSRVNKDEGQMSLF
ncbi:UvrD-helicase domain-containing protein [Geofilum sp. OHC36d9]|uniref:UvrD-helicase domain-containing protein n=1 Tax=Geofilum sp. OHC36d9 TaxID=3458413 RepID=UPI0040340DCB